MGYGGKSTPLLALSGGVGKGGGIGAVPGG